MLAAILLAASFAFGYRVVRLVRPVGGLWAEIAGGWIVGVFASTWLAFMLSFALSFSAFAVGLTAALLTAAAIALWYFFQEPRLRDKFRLRLGWAEIAALLLIAPFFIWGIWQDRSGSMYYVGNFTDIPFHLAMVSSFVQQSAFLPDYPQVAGAKLCYHFLINFHTALLAKGGLGLLDSLWIDQTALGLCLALLLAELLRTMAGEKAALWAVLIFVLAHAGVFNLLTAMSGVPLGGHTLPPAGADWVSARFVFLFPFFNFVFPLMNYFMPQRPFLFGFAAACLLYCALAKTEDGGPLRRRRLALAIAGTALLPLLHLHSFLLLASTILLLTAVRRANRREALAAFAAFAVALPQLWFLLSQPMSAGSSGWDVHTIGALSEMNVLDSAVLTRLAFWVRAAGLSFVLGIGGLVWFAAKGNDETWPQRRTVLWFAVPPLAFFALINFYRMMPSWGDSNKFYLFLHLLFAVFIARLFTGWWRKGMAAKVLTIVALLLLGGAASALTYYDFWRPRVAYATTGSLSHAQEMFAADELACAQWIVSQTEPSDVFLTADTMIHFLPALTGRRVVDGAYTDTNGLERPGVKRDVPLIYQGADPTLARQWGADYILLSRREQSRYHPDTAKLRQMYAIKEMPDVHWCTLLVVPK